MSEKQLSRSVTTKKRVDESLAHMRKGTKLTKVRKSRQYERRFSIDSDNVALRYDDSKKIVWLRRLLRKGDDMSKVYIGDIREVREGFSTDNLGKVAENLGLKEDQCFSIIVGSQHKSLDLVENSKQGRDDWVHGLRYLIRKHKDLALHKQQDLWLRKMFEFADKDQSGALELGEIVRLLKHLNIDVTTEEAKTVFMKADTNKHNTNEKGEATLDMEEFVNFHKIITKRPEVEQVFKLYTIDNDYLDPEEMYEFFKVEQERDDITIEECKDYIQRYEACPDAKEQSKLSLDGFRTMLNSQTHALFNSQHTVVYQDMTQPLNHYFIDSSHNTYLLEDQIVGPSSVEAYVRALQKGCRCVELDCWDGPDNEPVIYHGYTLTSKILFKDVISAIDIYAFKASHFPVILSIENHCSVDQQKVMARHMIEIFGDKLFRTPLEDDTAELPSPFALKGKILIKAKKLPPQASEDDDMSEEDEAAEMEDERVKQEKVKAGNKNHKVKIARELSDLVICHQSVHFKSFEHTKENYTPAQMSSFSENKAFDLVDNEPSAYVRHNTFQISRIYPSGLRTDSSNYDPVPMWNTGCSIVALNYQTPDDSMQINMGKFRDNGGCGYILKPDFLLTAKLPSGISFNPNGPFPDEWKRKIQITVISGYMLPKPKGAGKNEIIDPYVKIEIEGVPMDKQNAKTAIVDNNGFLPMWNESFNFNVNCPDLALIRFLVKDNQVMSKNDLIGQTCIPFNSIQPGYRYVHLLDKHDEDIWGTIFVHVTIKPIHTTSL
ncbi:unnamed protein product [Owenia fusiformis]|uniref:Phosphoinositide phospholipase C n=1 Tax=Owenia fusiformis TaxID=6347 RepID=A0A8J1U6I5_OWEFU|nr:unnamed protein product [Owenia fusiformis]